MRTVPAVEEIGEIGPEAVMPVGRTGWHLAQSERPFTLCGLLIEYGSRRLLWSDTPDDGRCALCVRRLGL